MLDVVGAEKLRRRVDLPVNEHSCVEFADQGFVALGQPIVSRCFLHEAEAGEYEDPCKTVDCEAPHIDSSDQNKHVFMLEKH